MIKRHYFVFENNQILIKEPSTWSLSTPADSSPQVFTSFVTQFTSQGIPALFYFDYHVERLLINARELNILASSIKEHQTDWIKNSLKSILINKTKQQRVRIRLNPSGIEFLIEDYLSTWNPQEPLRLKTVHAERPHPSIKSTDILVSLNARKQAETCGAHEALLISKENLITECAWSNIFWFDLAGNLNTTQSNCLPGVTRRIILEHHCCNLTDLTLDEFLSSASEIFISQSTSGISQVNQIDGKSFISHKLTTTLKQWFINHVLQKSLPLELESHA